ncbi:MAG: hypothetical protein K2X11_05285 [Acetobacteraceae bacterium]|nr:hypothetical protein [Acetobacteraceae bacterium]
MMDAIAAWLTEEPEEVELFPAEDGLPAAQVALLTVAVVTVIGLLGLILA